MFELAEIASRQHEALSNDYDKNDDSFDDVIPGSPEFVPIYNNASQGSYDSKIPLFAMQRDKKKRCGCWQILRNQYILLLALPPYGKP
eukprot:6573075-Ditylum_brightwellii.AAC.1